MRATRSDLGPRAAALALALGVGVAGCFERDVDTSPFRISVTLASGAPVAGAVAEATLFELRGTAAVAGETTLVVSGAVRRDPPVSGTDTPIGDVTITFDRTAAPQAAFPARLSGQPVLVEFLADPASRGPKREPLLVPGLRVATGTTFLTYEFLLGEATYQRTSGLPAIPVPIGPIYLDEDVPSFEVVSDWIDLEPAECGLVYLDLLHVLGAEGATLRRGQTHQLVVGSRPDPWNVLHVLSWHRKGACDDQASAWTQLVAWR